MIEAGALACPDRFIGVFAHHGLRSPPRICEDGGKRRARSPVLRVGDDPAYWQSLVQYFSTQFAYALWSVSPSLALPAWVHIALAVPLHRSAGFQSVP